MKRAKNEAIIYWLMPARAERDLFRSIIRILADEFQAPLFEPHLTLFAARHEPPVARAHLKQLKASPISLAISEVQFSAAFTKTLFARFRPSAKLHRLVAGLQREAGLPPKRISDPHLSLCYRKLPAKTKRELASAIRLPLREVKFDCVQAVICPMPTRDAEEVGAWQVIARKALGN